jgi:hypothetical protein
MLKSIAILLSIVFICGSASAQIIQKPSNKIQIKQIRVNTQMPEINVETSNK